MTTMDDEHRLQEILADCARATAKRPPCEARIDPDTCVVCTAWTSESLEAGVRLWGKARAPGTITTLAAEVLRLRERAARADSDASGYLADHAAALLDLGAVRDAARAHLAADDALTLARRTDAADVPTAEARALAARECLAGLVGYAGEVGR